MVHGSPIVIPPAGHTPGGLQFFLKLGSLFPTPRECRKRQSPPRAPPHQHTLFWVQPDKNVDFIRQLLIYKT